METDLWKIILSLSGKPGAPQLEGRRLRSCSHSQVLLAQEHGILAGPFFSGTVRDEGDGTLHEVFSLEERFYIDVGDGEREGLIEVPREAIERWEISIERFLAALSSVNQFGGEPRPLQHGVWHLGLAETPQGCRREIVFVPATMPPALDLALRDAARALGGPIVALLAGRHSLSPAAVEALTDQGICLLDLSEHLGEDLQVSLPDGDRGAVSEARLVIDAQRHEVFYHGFPVDLEPQAFALLHYLAQRGPDRFTGAEEVRDRLWRYERPVDQEPRAMADAIRKVRNGFRTTARKYGLDMKAAEALIENRPRVGWRLALPRREVSIR